MKCRLTTGFSFIEVLVGVVIVSIAALGLLMSAAHARGELQALAIKERAVDQLIGFIEYMKGRIADGNLTITEKAGDFLGETVYLIGDANTDISVPAIIYYDHITPVYTDSASSINRYLLHAWIEWQDFSTPRNKYIKRADMEMVMMEFPK